MRALHHARVVGGAPFSGGWHRTVLASKSQQRKRFLGFRKTPKVKKILPSPQRILINSQYAAEDAGAFKHDGIGLPDASSKQ